MTPSLGGARRQLLADFNLLRFFTRLCGAGDDVGLNGKAHADHDGADDDQ